jgi:hypothetical protein
MDEEFGPAYAGVIEKDLVLTSLSDRTPAAALADGEDPREVWLAICRVNEVPKSRWHGKTRAPKTQHAE